MEKFIIDLLGEKGILAVVGLAYFLLALKYSSNIFDFIEKQTFGPRNYILEKLELLFIEVKPEYVSYTLLFISVGMGILVAGFLSIFGKWILGLFLGMVVMVIGWKIPRPLIDFFIKRRIKSYQNQLVDALTLLSNGIRAGLSIPQALGMVVGELSPPISEEFNYLLQQNRLGVPVDECFDTLAKRIPTEDNDMFVSSVNILRETGGNLAETFDTIVSVIRERIRLQQKVDTFTAQGMFQGVLIASMPFFYRYCLWDVRS